MKTKTVYLEDTYQLKTYEKFPIVINKGKGCYVWDDTGKKYLDFYGGHAVALIGHCNPNVIKAVNKQLEKLIFYSNVVYNEQRAMAAEKLIDFSRNTFSQVFFCNSGTEANEAAIKIAKKYTGKSEIISFIGSFHGRTVGSLSVTGIDAYKNSKQSLMPNVTFAQFGNIESVSRLVTQNTAAIIVEPIQSIAGVNIATKDFYVSLKKLCAERNIVLIFDEIQTGLGRTGEVFFGNHFGISPDITTLAKGLASGLPAGAVLVNKKIQGSVDISDLGSTFGGGPVVCSAISATLDYIQKKHLIKNAKEMGEVLKKNVINLDHIVKVRGLGLLLGIELDILAKEVVGSLLQDGIITGTSANKYVLRIMPPITISRKEVDCFIKTLEKILNKK